MNKKLIYVLIDAQNLRIEVPDEDGDLRGNQSDSEAAARLLAEQHGIAGYSVVQVTETNGAPTHLDGVVISQVALDRGMMVADLQEQFWCDAESA
ncbi:MAG: hypothetical protein ACRCV9_07120 [Burkholderiaceae bacterium]